MPASSPSPAWITGLLRADAYDHPTDEITLVETHISWVILTGRFAYKLKKPVEFDFVDYSTAERREHFCHEELRLGRRFAPDIYLDVVAVTGPAESPKIGGIGKVIEHAVKMRQFSEDTLFSKLIKTGQLKPSHIDRLAIEIAAFHDKADVAPPDSPFGTPDAILAAARHNFETLLNCHLPPGHGDEIRRLSHWTEERFLQLADCFETRLRDGFVRECHGDLHLRNIILGAGGDALLFDGIEFNESFRWIDLINEVAFCAMDLADRGRPDLARRLLNAYLEHTGDYSGLKVAHFYIVYRAMVRAKVAALRLKQERESGAEIEPELAKEITAYFDLADRVIEPVHPPALAITYGLSGSGKTTGTQDLVDALGFIRIRSDVERKRLFGLAPDEKSGSQLGADLYTEEASEQTYRRVEELAEIVLGSGFSAIVDAAFLRREQRRGFSELAARLGVAFRILHFDVPEEELRRRVEERERRGSDASEANLEVLEHQLETVEALGEDESPEVIRIDSGTDMADAIAASLSPQDF